MTGRVLDVLGAGVMGVVLAPVLAVAAVAVAIDLGRPVMFVQARSGLAGRVFRMGKLRSMSERRDVAGAFRAPQPVRW